MRKEKAMVMALIGTMVLLSQAFGVLPTSAQKTDVISVKYRFDESEILNWLDSGQYMKNLRVQGVPGEPLVPYRTAKILLPPYAEVADVSVQMKFGGKRFVKDIPCGQPVVVIGEEPKTVEKNPAIYNSDELYPGEAYRVGSVSSFRGYNILHVRLYPVQYKPASKLATYYTDMTVDAALKTGNRMDTFRNLVGDRKIAASLVDNPEVLSTYDSTPATAGTLGTTYEYIIVTTPNLADEFQVLADWKANFVDGAKVVTVNVGANETEIKNVINDYYTNYNTSYVLLGGDVDVITYHTKTCTVDSRVADIAEDYWFANLRWEEDEDEISYYEVNIGRAPVDNEEEVMNFVNKVIAYEHTLKPKANLFHQSRVIEGANNTPDSRELAWQCEHFVPQDYTNYELFEENGKIEKTDWINFWRNDGIMCQHMGHGNQTAYAINYEVGGEVVWSRTDIASMDNMFWPVHTSVACSSGEFEYEWGDCLAEAYVKEPNTGVIASLFNDKVGLYKLNDATRPSGDFIEMQFKGLYQEGIENVGAMLAYSKHCFIEEATNTSDPEQPGWEWCWREINLIGDPETPLLTRRIQLVNVVENSGWETGDNSFWNVSTIQEPYSFIDYEVNQESACNSTYGFHVSMKTNFNKPLYTTQSLIDSQPLRNALLDTNTKLKYLIYPAYELNGVSEIPQARWEIILFFSTGNKLHYYGSLNMEPTENSTDKYVYMPITLDQWNEFFDDSVLETYIGKFGTPPIGTIITEIATYVASKTYATQRNKFNLVIANFDSDEDAGGLQCSAGYVRNVDTSLIYTSIQEAIDTPVTLDGHTISVQGVFHEHVVANKSLTLKGIHPAIIDGGGTGNVITLQANNFTISKFTIQNGEIGIYLEHSNNTSISDNTVTNFVYTGAPGGFGIYLSDSSNNSVSGNNIANNWYGIWLSSSSSNTISGNNITDNDRDGILLSSSSSNTISGNNITDNNWYGIYLARSPYNSVYGNKITANSWDGILLDSSSSNTISGNNITDNDREGIVLYDSSDNIISGNNIANSYYGIHLYHSSSNNTIHGNNITANSYYGIVLDSSSNNIIYHNNFVDNAVQVDSYVSTNVYDDGYPSGGNYWSDYEDRYPDAEEIDGSGIWDTPYVIDANNQDNYPLMHPWGSIQNVDTGLIYLTIQKAIDAPQTLDGHTIQVDAGTYYENVVVNKSVRLEGIHPNTAIIYGALGNVINVQANNVRISRFTIRNGFTGVKVSVFNQTYIDNNIISYNRYGIWLDWYSSNNIVSGNNITNNVYRGIFLYYHSNNNSISGNNITANEEEYGIYLATDCLNNSISGNNITNNGRGIRLNACSNNIISGNNIANNEYESIAIELASNNNIISGNNIANSDYWCGIWLYYSSNNSVYGNNITAHYYYGIILYYSSNNNSVYGNNIANNRYGIWLFKSSNNNIISGNNITANNWVGIGFDSSSNNIIYHNNFVDNAVQVDSYVSTNVYDDGYPSGGNCWSDYNGTDRYSGPYQNETSNDGIGDTPYVIDANNQDNYPLMQPWKLIKNIDTGLTYSTIQEAVDAPETLGGHTIQVYVGTYCEHVVVNKSLTLKGIHANTAIIDGSGTGDVVTVQANNVRISKFTIQNGQYGIDVAGDNNIANGNVVSDCTYGILVRGNNNNVSANFVSGGYWGVYSESYSYYSNISGNTVSDCYHAGIWLNDHDSYVKDNTISNTDKGIEVGFSGNVYSISGNTISNTSYGIWVDNEVLYISGNTISNNDLGINFEGYGIEISGNTISNNDLGINFDGFAFEISGNTISNNDLGLKVISNPFSFLIIYHNNFIDNTQQALDQTPYTPWDTGAEGNYWSDYTGTDADGDSIGDTPYPISKKNQDNYPLMHPWGSIRNVDTGLIYLTIQKAIEVPETLPGHTIEVKAGTYYEHVVVDKSLALIGEDPSTTIIDGSGTGNVVTVQANNVSINQFTIQNGQKGTYLEYSNNTSVSDNIVSNNNFEGILVEYSDGNTVSGNILLNDDIALVGSDGNTVSDNIVSGGGDIYLEMSSGNTVTGNIVTNSFIGIFLYSSSGNSFIGNTMLDNSYGVYLYDSSDNIIHHNNFIDNTVQALLSRTSTNNTWIATNHVGNYWSDYTGEDNNPYYGIGDTPYVIDERNNQDNYPLMWRWFLGDINGDGFVDMDDHDLWLKAWGKEDGDPGYNPIADLDYNGIIDTGDLIIWYYNGFPHDVAVVSVTAPPTASVGDLVPIDVEVKNEGYYSEIFDVTAYYDSAVIGTQTVSLFSGDETTVTFTWDTTGVSPGTYTIKAVASTVLGETDTADNTYVDGTVTVEYHDIAVTSVAPSPTSVGLGEPVTISVTVENQGDYTETFDVTTYYDGTAIDTQTVANLAAGGFATLTFTWDTTGVSPGTYTIKAVASTVPGETDTADNTYTDGTVEVYWVHDVAVTSVSASPTSVRVGDPVTITVDVENQGDYTEDFNVHAYYDNAFIGTQRVENLGAGGSTTLTFIWDTTGVNPINATIKARADKVAYETDTDDNTYVDGTVEIICWVSPTGYSDPDGGWSSETNAYDDDEDTYATTAILSGDSWSTFLYLTHSAITCDKVRVLNKYSPSVCYYDIDVYRDGAWVDVYEGLIGNTWKEISFAEGTVTQMRVRVRRQGGTAVYILRLYEADFGIAA